MKENLKRDLVNRPQRVNEPLALYINDVKNHAKVLMCQYSEKELVEIIKCGISVQDRSKLVFVPNPQSFKELDQMCIQCQNIAYNDHMRDLTRQQPSPRGNRPNYVHNVVENRPKIVCYNCGKIGHKSFQCYRPKGNSHNPKNM